MTARALLIKPGVSWCCVGHEEWVDQRFAEEVALLRALGYDPVEATAEIVAPVVGQ